MMRDTIFSLLLSAGIIAASAALGLFVGVAGMLIAISMKG